MTASIDDLLARRVANPFDADTAKALAYAHNEAGDYADAADVALTAEELGAGEFGEMAVLAARCTVQAGELDAATDLLMHALDQPLRDLASLRTDPDFAPLRTDPLVRQVLGIPDGPLDRDAGWQFDLEFFAQEVKRRAPDPFSVVSEDDFEAAVDALYEDIPTLSDAEILLELARMLVPLRDGHAYVCPAAERTDLLAALPLGFYKFDEGFFITHASADYADLAGSQLLSIDGHSTADVTEALDSIICRDNQQWPHELIPFRLREPALLHALGYADLPDQVVLTVADTNGRERDQLVRATMEFPTAPLGRNFPFPADWVTALDELPVLPLYLRDLRTPFWFEPLPELNAMYLQINQVRDRDDETLAEFTERFFPLLTDSGLERLILDLRMNKGGNTTLEWPFIHRLIEHPVNQRGRLFVVIGRRTFSAAQNFSTYLDLHTDAIFAGEPTGSSPSFNGESIEYALPWSDTRVNISDLRWQSSWPWDRRPWIAPDLYAPPTFAAYREGRDVALEAIERAIADPIAP